MTQFTGIIGCHIKYKAVLFNRSTIHIVSRVWRSVNQFYKTSLPDLLLKASALRLRVVITDVVPQQASTTGAVIDEGAHLPKYW